jgi:diguanylate cyclase (GGDEF)-like protein/PAS domain S-box-containing protein
MMRVLYLETDDVVADRVRYDLRCAEPALRVDRVRWLHEGFAVLRQAVQYDAVLIDSELGDGSGLDLLIEVRRRQLPLPVVMLTPPNDPQQAIDALEAGADDCVDRSGDGCRNMAATLHAACKRFGVQQRRRSRPLRVIYAGYDDTDIDTIRRHLARHAPNIHLTLVVDAAAALTRLPATGRDACDFDVVLLAYALPGIDTLNAVRTLRVERGLDLPVVIITALGSESVAARAIELGVDDFITKHGDYLHELSPTLERVHRERLLSSERKMLQRTSRHLAYMLEASPVVLYTLQKGAGGRPRATWVSANIKRLFGYSEQEAMASDWWRWRVHPDDRDAAVRGLAELERSSRVTRHYRFLHRDGDYVWVRDELRMLSSDADEPWQVLGAWHDVTEHQRADRVQQTRVAALDDLISGIDLQEVLGRVARSLEQTLPDMRVSILLYDSREHCLVTAAAPSLPAFFNAAVDGLQPQIGRGSCGTAAALGETVVVEDVSSHPYWSAYTDLTARAGLKACWSVPFKDEDGRVLGTFGIYHAETRGPAPWEMKFIEEFARIAGLAVQRARNDAGLRQAGAVFDHTQEGIVITDLEPRIIAVNRAYTEITGYSEGEVIGRNPGLLKSGRHDRAFYASMWARLLETGYWQGEVWNRRSNGEVHPLVLTLSTVRDSEGQPKRYIGMMTDITHIKQSEANLERLAHFDPLTGLPNRLLVQSHLDQALKQAQRDRSRVAVLFLDLDRFKDVNDSLGHPVGDVLLQALTRRLRKRLRGEDSFGRLGGDEFLIVLSHARRPESAATIARELIGLLEAPFQLPSGNEIYVGASIGISVYPQDGDSAARLIQHADAAMYQAKEQGRNTFRFYTPALTEAANRRIETEARMRRAIAHEEFTLYFQPQVEIRSGSITGCEVLLRWQDPQQGVVPPAEFVALAEETGLIVPIGQQLLHAAAHQFKAWLARGLVDDRFCLAINLSARQLQQADVLDQLRAVIEAHGLPAERLKLELTESVIMGREDDTEALLRALRDMGIKLSIDDFGTGYSSLAYLKRFPIDELKIDRSFVRDIPADPDDAEIAATIIAMARNLRLRVIAEGVETAAQAEFLLAHGCEFAQGYRFSPAVPAAEFEALLRSGCLVLADLNGGG